MELDLEKLMSSNLTPTLYVALQAIHTNNKELIQYFKNLQLLERIIEELERKGYVKIIGPIRSKDFIIRNKTVSLFGEIKDVNDWYEEWRNLFPEGFNQNGYRYRGNKQEVLLKMRRFVKRYPKYSKDDIIEATKKYIRRCTLKGGFMLQAHYFIDKKDVGSTLLTELESKDEETFKIRKTNKML